MPQPKVGLISGGKPPPPPRPYGRNSAPWSQWGGFVFQSYSPIFAVTSLSSKFQNKHSMHYFGTCSVDGDSCAQDGMHFAPFSA